MGRRHPAHALGDLPPPRCASQPGRVQAGRHAEREQSRKTPGR